MFSLLVIIFMFIFKFVFGVFQSFFKKFFLLFQFTLTLIIILKFKISTSWCRDRGRLISGRTCTASISGYQIRLYPGYIGPMGTLIRRRIIGTADKYVTAGMTCLQRCNIIALSKNRYDASSRIISIPDGRYITSCLVYTRQRGRR